MPICSEALVAGDSIKVMRHGRRQRNASSRDTLPLTSPNRLENRRRWPYCGAQSSQIREVHCGVEPQGAVILVEHCTKQARYKNSGLGGANCAYFAFPRHPTIFANKPINESQLSPPLKIYLHSRSQHSIDRCLTFHHLTCFCCERSPTTNWYKVPANLHSMSWQGGRPHKYPNIWLSKII